MEYLKLTDFTRYHGVSQLKLSASGGKRAVAVKNANGKESYCTAVYVDKGNGFKLLTRSDGSVGQYIWLDDDNILFSENRPGDKPQEKDNPFTTFYSINVNGGEAVKRFTVDMPVSGIEFISEGKYLIHAMFDNNLKGSPSDSECGSLEEGVGVQIIDELPYWTDGGSFINKKRMRLFVFDEKDGLTPVTGPFCRAERFELSPCKNYAVFSGETEYASIRELRTNLYLVNLNNFEIKRLTEKPMFIKDFKIWSKKILLAASYGEKYFMGENPYFYIVNPEDSSMTLLSEFDRNIGSSVNSDSAAPSAILSRIIGDTYYFISTDGFYSDIFALDLVSGGISRQTSAKGAINTFDISNGLITAIGMIGGRLQEVFSLENGTIKKLSSFNDAFYDSVKHPVCEHFTMVDCEGVEFDGWVLKPVDYQENKEYPAILDIHGGPRGVYSDVYMHEMQYWANKNYFVIFSNPRGSDGKGNAFADIRGRYGEIDYKNVMQLVDEALSRYPAINKERLGVTGGSYGGYMTNWIIGHTDRFKAAASQRSICNWFSYMIGDLGYFFTDYDVLANPWDNPEKLWDNSPLKYANKAKTPTVIIHSDRDYRCSVPEGYQMYTALKLAGVETRLCIFHDESHGLSSSGRPANRARRLREITEWMDKYLLK